MVLSFVRILLLVTIIHASCFCILAKAQVNPTQDSTLITQDTIRSQELLDNRLDNFKNKSNFNKFIYKLFVKKKKNHKTTTIEPPISYKPYQGKPIRYIYIESHDPFGYSLQDTTRKPEKFIEKAGNFLHPRSKKMTIKNYLLLRKNQAFDSINLVESERLLRSQRFIRNVKIEIIPIENSDSIDLTVKTLDSWSIIPRVEFSSNKFGVQLRERNFMGLGHTFDNRFKKNISSGDYRFQTSYTIPNIARTYIGINVGYYENEYGELSKGINIYRPFFSPLTRWAGGAYVGQKTFYDSIPNEYKISYQEFKYNLQDYWGGMSFPLNKLDKNHKDLNNLIFAARYFKVDYIETPTELLDPNQFYSNEEFYLFNIGVSRRSYKKDRYVRNFEIIEDIPTGISYGLTGGFQNKNDQTRFYYALKFKYGDYFRVGYLGTHLQYGTFLKNSKSEQSVLAINFNYFSNLYNIKNWKVRTFLNSDIIVGNNRFDSRADRVTLNENDPKGIQGFYSKNIYGTQKWLTNLTLQSYSPYQLWGFRISPFVQSTVGIINTDTGSIFHGRTFTKIGIGVSFSNDYLVFSNFKLSFSWYNSIPTEGNNIFKINDAENYENQIQDFDIGKPTLIPYNPYLIN